MQTPVVAGEVHYALDLEPGTSGPVHHCDLLVAVGRRGWFIVDDARARDRLQ
ncbi:MAG: hypothetical protein M5U34_35725 [Chloroflexi bacterium]|nr:hypothetical protein [Chloroflexota bacterium]